jgi:hypothetical protein
VKRLGSLRFDGALAQTQRDGIAHALTSSGIEVASWSQAASMPRTYAALHLKSDAETEAASLCGAARFDEPALLALEITPRDPMRLSALRRALEGPGRPAGVIDVAAGPAALVVELATQASLRLVLDTIDCELRPSPGRTIVPLLPLGDEALAAFAASGLGVLDLDARRLIETFSEPLLAGRKP